LEPTVPSIGIRITATVIVVPCGAIGSFPDAQVRRLIFSGMDYARPLLSVDNQIRSAWWLVVSSL
jgi:hypothetical protein